MEDVLDLYQQPLDEKRPLICMDERPVQLVKETRQPLPAEPGRPERIDYEYERNGTASVFLFTEPLAGWRRTAVHAQRTSVDWAPEIRRLLDQDYPAAESVILICDNLNTHKIASLYEAFEPEVARRLAQRLEIHPTPKHGSWLNVAEIELSVLSRQCLESRIPDLDNLTQATTAWHSTRNQSQKSVDWQFTTGDARLRLKRLYPQHKN
jgi:hypothetical protein